MVVFEVLGIRKTNPIFKSQTLPGVDQTKNGTFIDAGKTYIIEI